MNKRLLFSITILSFCFFTNAQVTITQNDFAAPGKYIENASDTFPNASITLMGTGAQTWDFSSLQNHGVNSTTITDPNTTPYYTAFPTSTMCGELFSTYSYYISDPAAITSLGVHADFMYGTSNVSITLKNSPAETIIEFPATYNSSFNSAYTASGKTAVAGLPFGADSARIKSVVNKSVTYDAYGSMTTPLGTYNTLRAKEYLISSDSIWIRVPFFGWTNVSGSTDTSTTYKWYANGLGAEMVSANFNDSTQKIDYVSWMYSLSAGVADASKKNTFKTYPSPANEVFYVQIDDQDARFVSLADINGKQLLVQFIEGKTAKINTAELPSGLYIYSVMNVANTQIGYGKVAVIH